MKITAFSDTHGLHYDVFLPKSDMFIFAGDCMTCGYKEHELIDFLQWYHNQDAPHKIMIAGNHDRYIENYRGLFLDLLKQYPSITYLENEGTVINGIYIWGTPDSKKFCGWAFNRTEEEMERSFSKIPSDIDILVSHAPQYGILDRLERGDKVGEIALMNAIKKIEYLRLHIFGHIHYQYGVQDEDNYKSANVSVVNEQYELQNQPVTFKFYPHG